MLNPGHTIEPLRLVGTQKAAPEVSVVTPMYNEELCVTEFCRRVDAALRAFVGSYEILVVNDGSTDRTLALLEGLAAVYPQLRVVSLARNSGQAMAVEAGLNRARGKYVIVMDGDLQHSPDEIRLIVDELRKGYDLVSGYRNGRSESLLRRRLPSAMANYLLRKASGAHIRDMGGFKGLKGDLARRIILRSGQHRLLPAVIHLMGGKVSDVPVSAPRRFAGSSHYGTLIRGFNVLFDVLALLLQSSVKARPVYFFGYVSMAFGALGSAIFLWLLYERQLIGIDMGTRPLFIVSILFLVFSFGSFCFGFTLEMLSDLRNSITSHKPYIVDVEFGGDAVTSGATAVSAAAERGGHG